MALINCPECQRQVSTRAESCPGCGCPVKQSSFESKGGKSRGAYNPATCEAWAKEQGFAPLGHNTKNQTMMHIAAGKGRIDCLQWLMDQGVTVDDRDDGGNTPLHEAAASGHKGAVDWLIYHGGDLSQLNDNGLTPTIRAVQERHVPLLRYLADKRGVKPYAEDHVGGMLTLWAAGAGQLEALKWLHSQGVSFFYLANGGITPAHLAAAAGHLHVLKWMHEQLPYANVFDANAEGNGRPIAWARKNGHTEVVRWLISIGVEEEGLWDDIRGFFNF